MDSSGNFQQELVFESILSYLLDSTQAPANVPIELTPSQFIGEILQVHNSTMPDDKKFNWDESTANIDDALEPGNSHTHPYDFDYKNSWETVKSMLIDRLKGYFQVRTRIDGNRYVNSLRFSKTPGADHPDQTVEITINQQSAEVEIDPTSVITRLIPLGATQEDLSDPTKETQTKVRLTIKERGDVYDTIVNQQLENIFGQIVGFQTWDDVTDPAELERLGRDWMARQIVAVNNWKIDTFETDDRTFYVGHRYQFVNDELAVSQLIRVTEKTVDITSPNNITLTIESTQSTLADYQVQSKKIKEELAEAKADLARNKRRTKALVDEVKKLQEENAQLRRDALVREGSGQTVAGGPTEPVNGDWGPVIRHAAALMNVQIDDAGVNLVKAQINLESGGNEKIVGGDDGLSDGRASGLLQYKPGTFNKYALEGHNDIWKGFDQLLAFFNIPNALSQITGLHGWSPSGAPRYSKVPNTEVSGGAKRLQDAARRYLGVRYVWGGAGGARGGDPFSGMDCSSFVSQVYKDLGINIPAYTVSMEPYGHEIPRSQVQAGDMGFYGSHGASYHITLALDNKRMIYEPAPGQSCMEQDIDAYPPTWWVRNDQMAAIVAGD
ncbi:secretory antigen SsaA-like protein [Ligilactobacillus equi DPC 6820]|uniref:Secretory antigen SsaA-like protein n=2 Tax=Ligilactobacillus equi TaxID=137357 RepID=V7HW85_9LACO|nr:secretory antigen SsaA-like protein [Ligilactobacillus equi DPC 6820]